MWEEHPWYQQQQARIIGFFVVALILLYAGSAVTHRDWHLLGQVLLLAAALAIAIGLLSGTAWLLVKVLTRRPKGEASTRQKDEHCREADNPPA
jgi:hypothetical protein